MRRKNQYRHRPLRIGFVALSDCAPLVVAQSNGYFADRGIKVELTREIGWATIRDKIMYGELDAAQAPAGLIVAANCGLTSARAECLTALVINLHGNGITLSQSLWQKGVKDGASLRKAIRERGEHPTLAVVHPYSSHHFLLRKWLTMNGINPYRDVNTVVIPPAQVAVHLKAGRIAHSCKRRRNLVSSRHFSSRADALPICKRRHMNDVRYAKTEYESLKP